jgi:hypothetical protein
MTLTRERAVELAEQRLRSEQVGLFQWYDLRLFSVIECDDCWSVAFTYPTPPDERLFLPIRVEVNKRSGDVRLPWLEE